MARQLSARRVAVRAPVRDPAQAGELAGLARVEVPAGDMAHPDTLPGALEGVDRAMLISSSDPYMAHVQTTFIDAAAKAGVAHIVKLSGIMPCGVPKVGHRL